MENLRNAAESKGREDNDNIILFLDIVILLIKIIFVI